MLAICAKKKVDFTSAHISFTKVLWHLCVLEYVLEMWESTSPMSEMPMFFCEKTPKFDKFGNFWRVCFLKRHGKHFLNFAC